MQPHNKPAIAHPQNSPLRGVNLGGWLLLEKWMTPSLFAGTSAIDEFTFMGTPQAEQKLDHHRKTFITEADFAWLQDHDITAIRIPVGYWVLQNDPPYVSATRYLDWAMVMASKYSLQVIIDVHGLPGSQNGRDHSGRQGKAEWYTKPSFRRQSLSILEDIARRYQGHPQFWGLQIINEPRFGLFQFKLRRYYREAGARLSRILQKHTRIIFSDAYTPRLLSGALKNCSHPVVMDVHLYHMTTPLARYLSLDWYFQKLARRKKMLNRLSRDQPLIIGEWSGVFRHATVQQLTNDQKHRLTKCHIAAQQKLFANTAGWFYWNYKTEAAGGWNYRSVTAENNNP